MNKMLIITDMKDWFWKTYPDWVTSVSLNVSKIKEYFKKEGFFVEVSSYKTFDFSRDYSGYYILYGSSEDYCGGTKDYIEDIILWLKLKGAYLLPNFEFFRAHDNKVMMELLRNNFKDNRLKTIKTRTYSSLEMLGDNEKEFPVVIKKSRGAGGEGVALVHNQSELFEKAKKLSRMVDLKHYQYMGLVNFKQKLLRKDTIPINNSKFIVQTFIPNLSGDYKVLVFGDHYFILHRLNRDKDFRASGSGKFIAVSLEEVQGLLNFASICKNEISTPHLSVDIGYDGKDYHLIEFQCITFGFKAMSISEYHYVPDGDGWKRVDGKVIPENEFCYGIKRFLEQN
jgi:hypothetical protein